MKKYFSDKDGNLVQLMKDSGRPDDEMYATIKLKQHALYRTDLPEANYEVINYGIVS